LTCNPPPERVRLAIVRPSDQSGLSETSGPSAWIPDQPAEGQLSPPIGFLKGETMKFTSQVLAAASGSVGGLTYSHNRGGMYTRTRAIPTNPNTARQQAVRSILGQLAALWQTLSTAQQAAWAAYGDNVAMTDRLGQTIHLSGQQHYIRSNVPRLQAGFVRVDNAPTTFNLGDFTQPTFTADESTPEVEVTAGWTDEWCDEDNAALLLYQGRPSSAGKNFFKGPFRYMGKIDGDAISPPAAPVSFTTLPYTNIEGLKLWLAAQVCRNDGRLSQRLILGPYTIDA
jgi:hypothetical protein